MVQELLEVVVKVVLEDVLEMKLGGIDRNWRLLTYGFGCGCELLIDRLYDIYTTSAAPWR
jgi:hypothetical protein